MTAYGSATGQAVPKPVVAITSAGDGSKGVAEVTHATLVVGAPTLQPHGRSTTKGDATGVPAHVKEAA